MGFFSDLKEDLSQAVNELMPEETTETEGAGAAGETEDSDIAETPEVSADAEAAVELSDLASMLDRLELAQEPGEVSGTDALIESDGSAAQETENEDLFQEEQEGPADADKDFQESLADAGRDDREEYTDQDDVVRSESGQTDEEVLTEEEIEQALLAQFYKSGDTIKNETDPEYEELTAVIESAKDTEEAYGENAGENKRNERIGSMMDEQIFERNETAADEKSVITQGMTINGDIVSKGSMDVLGNIVGNIDILGKLDISGGIEGNSKAAEIYAENAKIVGEVNSLGSVKIGQSTVIIGNISATSAVIAGAIKGDIDVRGPVVLDTSAIVMGNIKSKSVQINNGAVVEGLCSQCYADVNPSAFFDEFKKTAKA